MFSAVIKPKGIAMRYTTGNPYATRQSLYPAKPRPAPYPSSKPAADETEAEKQARIDRQVAARMRLRGLMNRAYDREGRY